MHRAEFTLQHAQCLARRRARPARERFERLDGIAPAAERDARVVQDFVVVAPGRVRETRARLRFASRATPFTVRQRVFLLRAIGEREQRTQSLLETPLPRGLRPARRVRSSFVSQGQLLVGQRASVVAADVQMLRLRQTGGEHLVVARPAQAPAPLAQQLQQLATGVAAETVAERARGRLEPAKRDSCVVNGLFVRAVTHALDRRVQLRRDGRPAGPRLGRRKTQGCSSADSERREASRCDTLSHNSSEIASTLRVASIVWNEYSFASSSSWEITRRWYSMNES